MSQKGMKEKQKIKVTRVRIEATGDTEDDVTNGLIVMMGEFSVIVYNSIGPECNAFTIDERGFEIQTTKTGFWGRATMLFQYGED